MAWNGEQSLKAAADSIGATIQPMQPRLQTLRERLAFQKQFLSKQLSDVEGALKLLDEQPSLEAFFNMVSRLGY